MDLISQLKVGRALSSDGYFSDVFEGIDPIQGRVALKVPKRLNRESDARFLARKSELLNEGQRLKIAEHQRVVRVFQVGSKLAANGEDQSEQPVYLVMEFCPGGSLLADYKAGPMELARLRSIAFDVSTGMQIIHNRGMLHRDIKPGNILIDDSGRAKIGDFGLVTDDIAYGYASGAGYLDHLAPEYFTDDITSQKTDVWAFGMTMYRLLHGHTWYSTRCPSPDEVQYGGYAAKLKWLPHIPDKWRRFIRRALNDDVDRRFQNFAEIAVGIEALPISPTWECKVSSDHISWRRQTETRDTEVIWEWRSPLRHRWTATSVFRASNRAQRKGSAGWLSPKQASRELETYFTAQR